MLGALLGGFHAHVSSYEVGEDFQAAMATGGLSYELLLMLGSKRKNFAFGGAGSFVHVPKGRVHWDDDLNGEYTASQRPAVIAGTLGPAVDYHPWRAFHVGGVIGLALENVPKFAPEAGEKDWLAGYGTGAWIGFDWKVDANTSLGVLMTGHLRRELNRDEGMSNPDNVEGSLSLGVGASLAYH